VNVWLSSLIHIGKLGFADCSISKGKAIEEKIIKNRRVNVLVEFIDLIF